VLHHLTYQFDQDLGCSQNTCLDHPQLNCDQHVLVRRLENAFSMPHVFFIPALADTNRWIRHD